MAQRWVSCRPGFFLPVRVLSRLFRRLFLEKLVAAHQAGRLSFFGDHAPSRRRAAFAAYLAPLRKAEWVVYAKRPFGGPQAVLAYLSRYTHRVAIANSRLIAFDQHGVTFRWKDYRIEGRDRHKLMTLATDEFIRRFLIHVLPAASTASATTACSPTAPRRQHRTRARAARRPKARETEPADAAERRRQAASLSMLRRPHDHHRDLRARRNATPPADSANDRHQDRHLMTAQPPSRKSVRRASPALDRPRRSAPRYPSVVAATRRQLIAFDAARRSFVLADHRRTARCTGSNSNQPAPRGAQIPIAPAAPPSVPLCAVSSLGGFRTPAAEYAAPSVSGRHPKPFTTAVTDTEHSSDQRIICLLGSMERYTRRRIKSSRCAYCRDSGGGTCIAASSIWG